MILDLNINSNKGTFDAWDEIIHLNNRVLMDTPFPLYRSALKALNLRISDIFGVQDIEIFKDMGIKDYIPAEWQESILEEVSRLHDLLDLGFEPIPSKVYRWSDIVSPDIYYIDHLLARQYLNLLSRYIVTVSQDF